MEIIARGVWKASGRILLCRKAENGYFYLPGGHVDEGESVRDALRREFLEETGLTVNVVRGLAIAECAFEQCGVQRHEINLVFHVEHLGGNDAPPAVESREPGIEFEWIRRDEMASLDFRPDVLRDWLLSALDDSAEGRGVAWLENG